MNAIEEPKSATSPISPAAHEDDSWYPPRNKVKTVFDILRHIRNWPDALELRIWRTRPSLRLLEFRNGLNVVLRGGSNEWSVVHEVLFAGGYLKALAWLKASSDAEPVVLDLGANIGLFSLLAARANPRAKIVSYEPGPPNLRLNRMNMLANPDLARRIELHEEAVAGASGEASWHFDPENPGGSSLMGNGGGNSANLLKVRLTAFTEVLQRVPGNIALLKMDIEGSEWDVLAKTPKEAWSRVQAIALELHDDATGQKSRKDFLAELKACGFQIERESVVTYFLHR